jgi:hypothetical protein
MTSIATKLLAQKQELLQRHEQEVGTNEREEIERLMAKINIALNLLDEAAPGGRAKVAAVSRP